MVKFESSKKDMLIMMQIANRVKADCEVHYDRQDLMMDLDAVNSNGCPLDFEKLRSFPIFDFCHDIYGILNHIDRSTGELTDCFLPRCAKPESEKQTDIQGEQNA